MNLGTLPVSRMLRSIQRLADRELSAYQIHQVLRMRGHKVHVFSDGYSCARVRFAQHLGQTVVLEGVLP